MQNISCISGSQLDYEECPGRYCGRILLNEINCTFSQCQKCPRGYRPSTSSLFNVCQPCANDLTLYDYMYLGFMLNTSLVLHFLFTDHSLQIIEKKTHYLNYLKTLALYLFSFFECSSAFILTILIYSPANRLFRMQTCSVESIYDWYTLFFNPYIDYYNKLNCSQEIVYPLFSFLIVFFLLSILVMVCTRPIFLRLLFKDKSTLKLLDKPIFAALYFFPVLIVCHIMAGGILYYSYPVITIIFFLISNAFYLCKEFKSNQSHISNSNLISNIKFALNLFTKPRHLFLILAHWYFYAFSLIAIVEFRLFFFNYYYLLFVPGPLVFFVISYKFTDPKHFMN